MSDQFTTDQLHALPKVLSAPRFSTYLRETAGDREHALALYQWNLEVSAALMAPLHVLEVSVRNGIADAIEHRHGGAWPWTSGFVRSLTDPPRPHYSPKRDLKSCACTQPSTGKVIAELKFAFWEKMLTSRFQGRIWVTEFPRSFPDAPDGLPSSQLRAQLRSEIEEVRKLRNRIAHHEPIFSRDIAADLARILTCIEWRNRATRDWVSSIEQVSGLLGAKP